MPLIPLNEKGCYIVYVPCVILETEKRLSLALVLEFEEVLDGIANRV